jgi:hypothetical protein
LYYSLKSKENEEIDRSGANVPPVSLSNVPPVAVSNVPPVAETNVPSTAV